MTIVAERWLPVVGWEDRYEVSDQGNVRSLWHRWGPRPEPRPMKIKHINPDGRPAVILSCRGHTKTRLVHQLVLEAFTGPRPPGHDACHGPGGMLDNRLANLYWATPERNTGADRVRDGTSNRGERHGMAKLTAASVIEMRRRYAAGESPSALAREFDVAQSCASLVVRRKTWRHI